MTKAQTLEHYLAKMEHGISTQALHWNSNEALFWHEQGYNSIVESVFFLSHAECCWIQHEHPHARSPGQFLSGYVVAGTEGRRAARETRFRARCGLLTNGHAGESLAANGHCCQQEEGKMERLHVWIQADVICVTKDSDKVVVLET